MQVFKKGKRGFLVLLLATVATLLIMLVSYNYITEHARTQNWDVLENASTTEAKLLRTKLEESTKTLDFVAEAVAREGNYNNSIDFYNHIQVIQSRTIFEGIDMILADGTVYFNSGEVGKLPEGQSFEQLVAMGKGMTQRMPGYLHKDRQFVRYLTPVIKDGEKIALIVGSINCNKLDQVFQPDAYNGQVIFCIVDAKDGSFILDNWHQKLGNIYDMTERIRDSEFSEKDVHDEIGQMRTGSLAFISKTTGDRVFMYYRPLYFYSWMLLLGVEEKTVFANLFEIKRILWLSGLFIIAFFIWNVIIMRKLNVTNDKLSLELGKSQHLENNLKKALLLAQKANQAKSDFLSRMSHDIRTPINGILGMLEIIKKYRTDERKVDDALDKIKTSSNHLLSLINSVLDMSKLESGNITLQKNNFNLNITLQECQMMLETQAQAAHITYNLHVAQLEHYELYGSVLHLRQVLLNIASNAIKYNKPYGLVDVYVRELKCDEKQVSFEFKFIDTGIGMSQEFIDKGLF